MIVDAGFFIGIERNSRRAAVALVSDREAGGHLVTSAGVVAQVWRDGARQARLAHLLRLVDIVPLDEGTARSIGLSLAGSDSSDVVDAHLALLSIQRGEPVATSDRDDLESLGVPAALIIDV